MDDFLDMDLLHTGRRLQYSGDFNRKTCYTVKLDTSYKYV